MNNLPEWYVLLVLGFCLALPEAIIVIGLVWLQIRKDKVNKKKVALEVIPKASPEVNEPLPPMTYAEASANLLQLKMVHAQEEKAQMDQCWGALKKVLEESPFRIRGPRASLPIIRELRGEYALLDYVSSAAVYVYPLQKHLPKLLGEVNLPTQDLLALAEELSDKCPELRSYNLVDATAAMLRAGWKLYGSINFQKTSNPTRALIFVPPLSLPQGYLVYILLQA